MSLGVGTASSSRFTLKSARHSGVSCDRFLRAPGVSSSLFVFLFFLNCNRSLGAPQPALSHRVIACRVVKSYTSFRNVEEILVDELEDPVVNPRKTIGTWGFPYCDEPFCLVYQEVVIDHWSTRGNICVLGGVFQARVLVAYPRRYL